VQDRGGGGGEEGWFPWLGRDGLHWNGQAGWGVEMRCACTGPDIRRLIRNAKQRVRMNVQDPQPLSDKLEYFPG